MDPKSRIALIMLIDKALAGSIGQAELDRARAALLDILAAGRYSRSVAESTFRLFIEIALYKSVGSIGAPISRLISEGGVLDEVARREAAGFRKWQRATRGRGAMMAMQEPQSA